MATIPGKIQKFKELEMDAFSTVAQASWQKAAGILEYANKSFPIGMFLFFYASQDNLPAQPDPQYWHYCDGSVINNVNSVFNGVTSPDCRGKFFKHPKTGDVLLSTAGSDTIDLSHSHGGVTQLGSDYDSLRLDDYGGSGPVRGSANGSHQHVISSAIGVVSTIPAYEEAQVYMRIA